ncbi:MAG TPA: DUF1573 domain-containing protein [Acidobacteriota bacterium]|nr:DUF1573 domain-containing protein [Acidobacteriota bacterium]
MKTRRFRHLVHGAVLFLLLAVPVTVGGESKLAGPRLRVSLDTFDFGYSPQHAQVAHVFWMRNTGTETAIIERVKTNCGCTQAPLADSVIAPGDSTSIEIVLGTGRMLGSIEKYTRVMSNAIGWVPALTIRAHVLDNMSEGPPVAAEPSAAFIDPDDTPAEVGGWWEYPVTLRNGSGRAVTLTAVYVPDDFIHLPASEFTVPAGGSRDLTLRIAPSVLEQPYSKSVTFELDDAERTRLTLPFGKRPPH